MISDHWSMRLIFEIINNDPFLIDEIIFLAVAFLFLRAIVPQVPAPVRRLFWPFEPFIDLREAEALVQNEATVTMIPAEPSVSKRRNRIFVLVGAAQILTWSAIFWHMLLTMPLIDPQQVDSELLGNALVSSISWTYCTWRPIKRPRVTPAYDLLIVYILLLLRALEIVGVPAYESYVRQGNYFTADSGLYATVLNLIVLISLIVIVLQTPVVGPPASSSLRSAIGRTISPEDYTTLWNWITFSWIIPLTRKEPLYSEEDIWNLTPTMTSSVLYEKYKEVGTRYKRTNGIVTPLLFFRHWWSCNSFDIVLLFFLTTVSILLKFTSPIFLKLILDTITLLRDETNPYKARQLRVLAMMYAFATFICTIIRAVLDLHSLFYGRRVGTRSRSEWMAAIYEKALKRRDIITLSSKVVEAKYPSNSDKKQKERADLGKLVNLMSTDTTTLETTINMPYLFYDCPIEILFAFAFLYYLLGLSAFAGVAVFAIVAPLNHLISRRASKVLQNRQTASDKKMSVINEMISEIKFIKFMASEDRWMKRVLEARATELKYIRQSRYIDVIYSLFWSGTPTVVALVTLGTFILTGNRLTVSTAFTVISLFSMMGHSLSMFPAVIVQILKVKISIKRIAGFLSEPEVETITSSLKSNNTNPASQGTEENGMENEKLGIENGTFLWSPPDTDPGVTVSSGKEYRWRSKFWYKPATSNSNVVSEAATTTPAGLPTHSTENPEQIAATSVLEGGISDTPASSSSDRPFQLRNINVLFPPNQLSLIIGPTASGKTALLRALLGEMYALPRTSRTDPETRIFLPKNPTVLSGSKGMRKYVSYASQTPWIEQLTIKENILFGSGFDEARYRQVIECCALIPDLEALEDRDETEIGERGISLSGGQKARVALARAVYAPTAYVLLDDPLSAVDSHTARFLSERLFQGPLLANRTVVLVTHHVDLVTSGADYVVRMLDGYIETQGAMADLQQKGILQDIETISSKNKKEKHDPTSHEPPEGREKDQSKVPKKLVEEEERARGPVSWSIYKKYVTASAYSVWGAYLFLIMLRAAILIGERLWMQIWGEAYEKAPVPVHAQVLLAWGGNHPLLATVAAFSSGRSIMAQTLPSPDQHPMFYVGIFASIGLSRLAVKVLAGVILILGSYRASKLLFGQTLDSVTRATMRFHDTTPTGRILNRFSKDYNVIDMTIASSFGYSLSLPSTILLSLLTVIFVSPVFIIPGIFIGIAYLWISKVYIRTSRPLKRLDSTTLSPIFSSFRTSLEGLATIRAFSAERRFINRMMKSLDTTTKCFWAYWMMNQWCLFIFDTIGAVTILVVMIMLIAFAGTISAQKISPTSGTIEALSAKDEPSSGLEGLVIVTAMEFTTAVYWACRFLTRLELDLNSVERIAEYEALPQEPPAIIESRRPPAYWPSTSSMAHQEDFITVEDLVIKYAPDLPAVLRGVSFKIKAGERVGLVGRTGSGKSTLATALLRFVEPYEGRIIIDGIDISTIGLHDLRSRVTFIPQDSVLFSGTIRDNLDPYGEYTDVTCLDVLHRVHLVDDSMASTHPTIFVDASHTSSSSSITNSSKQATVTLDSVVSPAGSNFSHGQRQLIALARALLRKTSVIIMDEATSSIDFETDAKIQEALRDEFKSSCVITIAHRLQTVIAGYDRVIVMDSGTIVENGSPTDLIANVDGVFHSMCAKAGISERD